MPSASPAGSVTNLDLNDALKPAWTGNFNERHQMHSLVLCLIEQGPDPAFLITHLPKAAKVEKRATKHSREGGNGFQDDRSIDIALRKKRIGEKASSTGRDHRHLITR